MFHALAPLGANLQTIAVYMSLNLDVVLCMEVKLSEADGVRVSRGSLEEWMDGINISLKGI